jgi:hypothetical protein
MMIFLDMKISEMRAFHNEMKYTRRTLEALAASSAYFLSPFFPKTKPKSISQSHDWH